jgi:hypothetical protein
LHLFGRLLYRSRLVRSWLGLLCDAIGFQTRIGKPCLGGEKPFVVYANRKKHNERCSDAGHTVPVCPGSLLFEPLHKALLQRITTGAADTGGKPLFSRQGIATLRTIAKVLLQLRCLPCIQLAQDVLREQMLVGGPVYVA